MPCSYDVVACDTCGFCFADTAATQDVYDAYYADMSKYADSGTSTGAGLSPWDAERLDDMAGQVAGFASERTARILDIGCANGGLLSALRRRGFTNVCGIDPSSACVEQAREIAKGDVWKGTLSSFPDGIGKFDGVILSHVLEHIRDLCSALACIRQILNPDGWVYLEVPDAARYESFLVAPFQDFNTEHINHFSSQSLANLCRCTGFLPLAGDTKEIFSAKNMPYPAVSWFSRMIDDSQSMEKDTRLRPALEGYIRASQALMNRMDEALARLLAVSPSLIVWGVGQLTLKLLSDTCLRKADIKAFVDGSPVNQGRTLRGLKIINGHDLPSSAVPILVGSTVNATGIVTAIRSLGLTNPIVTLPEGVPL